MFPIEGFADRFGEILSALDGIAGECDAGASEDLEDLNAELEDALLLISELDPRDGDEREELAGALEDLRALAGDYRALAKAVPGVAEQARRLDMAAGLALSALDE